MIFLVSESDRVLGWVEPLPLVGYGEPAGREEWTCPGSADSLRLGISTYA